MKRITYVSFVNKLNPTSFNTYAASLSVDLAKQKQESEETKTGSLNENI